MKRIGRREFINYSGGLIGLLLLGKLARLPFSLRSTTGEATDRAAAEVSARAVDGLATVFGLRARRFSKIDD